MKLFKKKTRITKMSNHDIALLTIGIVVGFLIVLILAWQTLLYILNLLA